MPKTTTFLMFTGQAKEAVGWYVSLFNNSKIVSMKLYDEANAERAGTVELAVFTLDGQEYMAIDSPDVHDFTFTPSMSIFVKCESEEEIQKLWAALSEGGKPMMPLGDHGFSKKFGWTADKYGVSWQLNLE